MTDITIPREALEAGAKLLCKRAGYDWTNSPDVHKHWNTLARAAFLAMVGNWKGMFSTEMEDAVGVHRRIILPLELAQKESKS